MNRSDHPWKKAVLAEHAGGRPKGSGCSGSPEIPVAKLLEAFKKSGLSKCEVARRLGWMKAVPDIHRLNIAMGLERPGRGAFQKKVTYKTALRLCRAMNADIQEVGV